MCLPMTSNSNVPEFMLDSIVDKMLTERDAKEADMPDPFGHAKFPSLGFENETRGSYFMQVEQGDVMVSVWRLKGADGEPDRYHVHVYHRVVYAGVASWGGNSTKRVECDALIQVQAVIHDLFTSGGNDGGE